LRIYNLYCFIENCANIFDWSFGDQCLNKFTLLLLYALGDQYKTIIYNNMVLFTQSGLVPLECRRLFERSGAPYNGLKRL